MSLNRKQNSRKIKTEVSSSQSLPKFRIQTSKTVFYQPKINEIVSQLRQFPQKWRNPSLILKKTSLNLDAARRISTVEKQELISSSKKILPHPINLKRTLIHSANILIQKKILKEDNLVHITAQKWLIYDCLKGENLKGYKYKKQHDIAHLSQLLIFYTAYAIIKEYRISIQKTDLIVMKDDEQVSSQHLNFKAQNILSLQDCLYLMLLNNRNDATSILVNNLGFLCQKRRQNMYFSCFDINRKNRTKNISFFISMMKIFAKKLQLNDTYINDSHCLSKNVSNAKDIAKLFEACWEIPLFQKIISTKQRKISIKYINCQGNLCFNQIFLKSTKQLTNFNKHFKGGISGQNSIGGHSFVSYFQIPQVNRKFIIVVLGSYGKEQKCKDTQRLYEWIRQFSK